jgi:uncharacterized membrane protein
VGTVGNVDGNFTPTEFSPSTHALPGFDGQVWAFAAPAHPLGMSGRAEAAEGTRIVGEITQPGNPGAQHAVLWDVGTVTDLEAQSGFRLNGSTAEAVNADDVCGSANGRPACWLSGVFVLMPTETPGAVGDVTALNEQGNAAGWSMDSDGTHHCTYWPVTGGMVDCHSDTVASTSEAEDMNASNQIVGTASRKLSTTRRGFVALPWGMILLEPFGNQDYSYAHGINDAGLIVGRSAFPRSVATVWENGVPIDLQPRLVNADGWTLTGAIGVRSIYRGL